MTDYRRNRVPGGTFFFTVNLYDRGSRLLVERVDLLRDAVRQTIRKSPFHINAWVVLPDHLHCLWTLPTEDLDYSARWSDIKAGLSRKIPVQEYRSTSRKAKRERGIWQRRFWEHTIRDEKDYAAHMDYIHFNPVRHGLAVDASHWPYSSFHLAVAKGLYPRDWAGSAQPAAVAEMGERWGRD